MGRDRQADHVRHHQGHGTGEDAARTPNHTTGASTTTMPDPRTSSGALNSPHRRPFAAGPPGGRCCRIGAAGFGYVVHGSSVGGAVDDSRFDGNALPWRRRLKWDLLTLPWVPERP